MSNGDLPKTTIRHLRERDGRLAAWRAELERERACLVTDIQEKEAELRAMNQQLAEIDSMLHKGPRSV